MRAAPAVSVRCTGGPVWRAWCTLLPALAAAALLAWAFGQVGKPEAGAWMALGLVGFGLVRARRQPLASDTLLAWDGHRWSVDGTAGSLAVMLDLGPWLLLRVRFPKGHTTRWVAVSAHEAGAAWHLLRVAVFAQPPQPLGDGPTGLGEGGHG